MSKSVGERLKEERLRLGLSRGEFGALGGVKEQAEGRYERGDRPPDTDYLEGLWAARVDIFYIITGQRLDAFGGVREGEPAYRVVRYANPQDALMEVIEVQSELGRLFTTDQLKAILGYAYTAQASRDQIKLFVEKAQELFGNKGAGNDTGGEG